VRRFLAAILARRARVWRAAELDQAAVSVAACGGWFCGSSERVRGRLGVGIGAPRTSDGVDRHLSAVRRRQGRRSGRDRRSGVDLGGTRASELDREARRRREADSAGAGVREVVDEALDIQDRTEKHAWNRECL
jgi:hypothetical protein